jgi:deoxyribodipyrimidine photo-lyase
MKLPFETALVWLRSDLRSHDHPTFNQALAQSERVAAIYIHRHKGPWPRGAASCWWLHHALNDLKQTLAGKNIPLILMQGDEGECLKNILKDLQPQALFFEKSTLPYEREIEKKVQTLASCEIFPLQGSLLHQPEQLKPASSTYYQVFTPFYKRLLTLEISAPLGQIPSAKKPWNITCGLSLDDLQLLPDLPWDREFYKRWDPSEKGAFKGAKNWLEFHLQEYEKQRDYPAIDGTSHLSMPLHLGQITPRQILFAVKKKLALNHPLESPFTRQIAWREFAYHLLWHAPSTTEKPLRKSFEAFPWDPLNSQTAQERLLAWKRGLTGYPIIDAAMRQLWQTGWMHNRLRMIVGSFLVKDLHISWNIGASWFWDTLLDADLANNTLGWQWIAGCGADAAPYFRIFNPVTQSQKFDPQGEFIQRFVPELRKVKEKTWVHAPWLYKKELQLEGIELGKDYPYPIVDHALEREKALQAYQSLKDV